MHLIVWTIFALALLHSSQAVATTVSFQPASSEKMWAGGSFKLICTHDPPATLGTVMSYSFKGQRTSGATAVSITASRGGLCTNPFSLTQLSNDVAGRVALDSTLAAVTISQAATTDSDTYKCTITLCASSAVNTEATTAVQSPVVMAVPPKPTFTDTADLYTVYEDQMKEKTITCNAEPGQGGKITLSLNDTNLVSQDIKPIVADGLQTFTKIYNIKLNRNSKTSVWCEASNTIGTESRRNVDFREFIVQYPPSYAMFTSNKLTEYPITATTTADQYVMNAKAPLNVIVTCQPDSKPPVTSYSMSTVAPTPTGIVKLSADSKQAQIETNSQVSGSNPIVVKLSCTTAYSNAPMGVTTPLTKTSTLTINVTPSPVNGASPAKFSVAAFLATLMVFLVTCQ